MRPIYVTVQLDTADADGIAQAQQLVGAGDLVLNGALVSGGVATLDAQRRVYLDSAGNLSGVTFTVYGTDNQGHSISESLVGPNTTPVNTLLDFLTVTRIAASAAVGTNVTAGTGALGSSAPIPVDQYLTPTNIGLGVTVSGTVNFTVQHTFDDIFAAGDYGPFTWFDHPTIDGDTADVDGNYAAPPRAIRLLMNSGTGTATLAVIQAGATG